MCESYIHGLPHMNLRFHFMVNIVAGWVNRHQQAFIEYLTEERQILIEQSAVDPKHLVIPRESGLPGKQKCWEDERSSGFHQLLRRTLCSDGTGTS